MAGKVHGGKREGAGRKPAAEARTGRAVTVWLEQSDVEYLELVCPGNKSLAVREILARAVKMWPKG